jgi:hypothetical protein
MITPTTAIFTTMIAEAETNMRRLEQLIIANPSAPRVSLEIWQQLSDIKSKRIGAVASRRCQHAPLNHQIQLFIDYRKTPIRRGTALAGSDIV